MKIRTIITTDGEIDDINSFVRFLYYSNEMDVEGIILTSSMFHFKGDGTKEGYRWTGENWIPELINEYRKIYPNLIIHDENFPTPDELLNVYRIGNITDVSEMTMDSPGSALLMERILDNDDRTLFIQSWGGTNTTARALKSIQDKYERTDQWQSIKSKIEEKVVLFMILEQDKTYQNYIKQNWDLKVIFDSMNFGYFAYRWKSMPQSISKYLSSNWQQKYLLNKNPLLIFYGLVGDGYYLQGEIESEQFGQEDWLSANSQYDRFDFISEGDTLNYLFLLPKNLISLANPEQGSWSGRFSLDTNNRFSSNQVVDYNPLTQRFEQNYTFQRWIKDIQQDFASRIQWSLTEEFNLVNHYPIVEAPDKVLVNPGETVQLKVKAKDLNNRPLSYEWWIYYEVSTYWDFTDLDLQPETVQFAEKEFIVNYFSKQVEPNWELDIEGKFTDQITLTVPSNAKVGQTMHLILEVSNDGEYSMKTYKRIILEIK